MNNAADRHAPDAANEPPTSSFPAPDPSVTPTLSCSAVLTHHWLVRRRGGERVLEAFRDLCPNAPLYTLVYDESAFENPWSHVRTSVLQKIPGAVRIYPSLLPLMPCAARRIKLPPVDLVLCSDAALAKCMTPHPRSLVVCYCHSPMRYVWDLFDQYRRTIPAALRPLWSLLAPRLRRADERAAARVDLFIANSRHVADRIRRHYHRDSTVIHPPVDLPSRPVTTPRADFYLCLGHHVPYKRLDLAVDACEKLERLLIVIGDGPDVRRLSAQPRRNVHFLGSQPDHVVRDHLSRARGLLFPGEEDFGIVPVEAIAHGCPVVAFALGGATETVVPGESGVWFDSQSVDALAHAVLRLESSNFDPVLMWNRSQSFRRDRFLRQLHDLVTSTLSRRKSLPP